MPKHAGEMQHISQHDPIRKLSAGHPMRKAVLTLSHLRMKEGAYLFWFRIGVSSLPKRFANFSVLRFFLPWLQQERSYCPVDISNLFLLHFLSFLSARKIFQIHYNVSAISIAADQHTARQRHHDNPQKGFMTDFHVGLHQSNIQKQYLEQVLFYISF